MATNPSSKTKKRYATVAIVFGGAVAGGTAIAASANERNYGLPFTHRGQTYYIPNDSRRAIYPNQAACYRDVPVSQQSQCEPTSSYGGSGGTWYGPIYNSRSSYQPASQYQTQAASARNVGQKLPDGANKTGFGANGKAFTGSKGG